MKSIGSRLQVYRGKAKKTSGNLQKKDLKKNKYGNIVSKKVSRIAHRKSNLKGSLRKKP